MTMRRIPVFASPPSDGTWRRRLSACAPALVLLLLAGCGGGGSSAPDSAALDAGEERRQALAAVPAAAIVYSGPIVITRGGTYIGNWQSLDPDVPAVTVRTTEPVLFTASNIRSRGYGINAMDTEARVTVTHTRGVALNPNLAGRLKGCFIDTSHFVSVVLDNNWIEGWSCGIRALNYEAAEIRNRSGQTVFVRRNQFRNIDGRPSDGAGGYLTPLDTGGQVVQLNAVLRSNTRIEWNEAINEPYKSRIEDGISAFASGGTAGNPIIIANNYIQGGYHGDPAAQVDYTGAMINLGDCPSGDIGCAYVEAFNNVVVSFSNSGMGIAGGHHMRLYNNRAVSAARAPGGTLIGSTWRVGYGFWNFYDSPNWGNNVLFNNYALVINRDGLVGNNYFPSATPESVYGNVIGGTGDQPPPSPVTTDTERREREAWLRRAKTARVKLGPA